MTEDEKKLADMVVNQLVTVLTGCPIPVATQALCEVLATLAIRHMPDPERYCRCVGANALAMIQHHAIGQSSSAGKTN